MTQTITDLNAYIAPLLDKYPSVSGQDLPYVAKELSALQQRFFLDCRCEYEKIVIDAPNDLKIDLSLLFTSSGGDVTSDTVVSVFCSGREFPIVPEKDYPARSGDCCAFMNGLLCLKASGRITSYETALLVKVVPPQIAYSGSAFTGSILMPEYALPLVFYKLTECLARLAGEYEEADAYAKAFNAAAEGLKQKRPEGKKRAAL